MRLQITAFSIHAKAFQPTNGAIGNLRNLQLSFNNIDEIHDEWFSRLQSLEYINLRANVIVEVWPGAFSSTRNVMLSAIDLRCNRLVLIRFNFSGLKNLRRLRLDHNRLTAFSELYFSPLIPPLQTEWGGSIADYENATVTLYGNKLNCGCDTVWLFGRLAIPNSSLDGISEEPKVFYLNSLVVKYDIKCSVQAMQSVPIRCVFYYAYMHSSDCLEFSRIVEKFMRNCKKDGHQYTMYTGNNNDSNSNNNDSNNDNNNDNNYMIISIIFKIMISNDITLSNL